MKSTTLISMALILAIFPGLNAFANNKEVIATVNGKKILKSDFEEAYKKSMMFVSKEPVSKEKVLNDLINRQLGIKRAETNNLGEDPIVKTKLNDVLYHAQISKDLETQFRDIKVTDKDVERYYKNNKEIRSAHILLRVRAEPSKEEVDAALEQSLKIYSTLKKNPDKFAELANKFSQSSSAGAGGDLGYQPSIRYAPEYYDAIKNKKVGYISPPIRTQYGFHIVKVLGIKGFNSISLPLYKKIVYDEKRDAIIDKYFKSLRKNAQIKINKNLL
ncbi:MAG: peptidylprolyl isomerase [Bacteriovoracaceae bacterium]